MRGNQERHHRRDDAAGSIPACAGEPGCWWSTRGAGWVYPRVCGGTGWNGARPNRGTGLSPRVRGNRLAGGGAHPDGGSIPACAGEPGDRDGRFSRRRVYPRVCGGTAAVARCWRKCQGLSPRVRGNRGVVPLPMRRRGSIPACAGEPATAGHASPDLGVYPRVCGGTSSLRTRYTLRWGLSPRVRGNPHPPHRKVKREGSIPACAGEPSPPRPAKSIRRVYPRVCGGTVGSRHSNHPAAGLSPRVRGNPAGTAGAAARRGSIPACAGEPPKVGRSARWAGVYPRVCGGTGLPRTGHERHQGLSPRVRGNLVRDDVADGGIGSIPACAGEPTRACRRGRLHGVYPRVCGGTLNGEALAFRFEGLSPRVRGNRGRNGEVAQRPGSIPACAGEPRRRSTVGGWSRVYPRVCGGTGGKGGSRRPGRGLSPRVRGNPERVLVAAPDDGSIPACAGEPIQSRRKTRGLRVYPRVCGGTGSPLVYGATHQGLSPRVRGNLPAAGTRRRFAGSIPACAGEPRIRRRRRARCRVYPRVCGGTAGAEVRPSSARGLSPRVRGNHVGVEADADLDGSIPACAGEPPAARTPPSAARVYPRVCGGTGVVGARRSRPRGLSPRVRGNRAGDPAPRRGRGSIPACAGEPAASRSSRRRDRVYPRVCGGTWLGWRGGDCAEGLSPRVRGNRARAGSRAEQIGSIPACAGEPRLPMPLNSRPRVYPRVCGGTLNVVLSPLSFGGLSPRVRGNHHARPVLVSATGSIPACAGEPCSRWSVRSAGRVYPRVCGGTPTTFSAFGTTTGLSPRVRGNLNSALSSPMWWGSIPACAGEPSPIFHCAPTLRVYPRVCGGTSRNWPRRSPRAGLSPRVRGNPGQDARGRFAAGSIPACAGEPKHGRTPAPQDRVYPRVCGGTTATCLPACPVKGLSPRVRGNRIDRDACADPDGSIPACAGEPFAKKPLTSGLGVYPRVCGGTPSFLPKNT